MIEPFLPEENSPERAPNGSTCTGRAFWQVALDALDSGVAFLNDKGEILTTNAEWQRQFAPSGTSPRNAAFWLGDISFERIVTSLLEGERADFECEFRRSHEGHAVWYQLRLCRLEETNDEEALVGASLILSCRDITQRKAAIAGRERAAVERAQRQEFLARAGEMLAGSLDFEHTLEQVAKSAVPFLADWCFVDLLEGDSYRRVAVAHSDPSQAELARSLKRIFILQSEAENGISKVLLNGETQFYNHIDSALIQRSTQDEQHRHSIEALGARSVIVVGLRTRGRTLGALTLMAGQKLRRIYTRDDVHLAEDLARLAALSVDNARLFSQSEAANRARDNFLAVLSHELRTPLTSILGWVYLLRQPMHDQETHQHALQTIEDNARAQERLVENLIDVSRMVAGKLILERHSVVLSKVLNYCVKKVRPTCAEKSLRLSLHVPEDSWAVTGDELRLRQVVENLLDNAIKFTPAGGHIAVQLAFSDTAAVIEVRDDGQGIDPDFLPELFGLFQQADASPVRRVGGLGLGLAIAHHIVELHAGTLEVKSAGRGRGTTIRVSLPLHSAHS